MKYGWNKGMKRSDKVPMLMRLIESHVVNVLTECWEWTKYKNDFGYGRMGNGSGLIYAHRASYETFVGPIPDKLYVLHRCDNPSCINPEHLFLGTYKDNNLDCQRKGRKAILRGEASGAHKLTTEQVLRIRELCNTFSDRRIARMFDVSYGLVWQIRHRRSWRHLA